MKFQDSDVKQFLHIEIRRGKSAYLGPKDRICFNPSWSTLSRPTLTRRGVKVTQFRSLAKTALNTGRASFRRPLLTKVTACQNFISSFSGNISSAKPYS